MTKIIHFKKRNVMQVFPQWVFLITLALFSSCDSSNSSNSEVFVHQLDGLPTPWLGEQFNSSPDKFTFAIISDLNGGERQGIFEKAVTQINLFKPEFILSVGDLIEGGTEDKIQLKREFDNFDDRALKFDAPFFHVGGNHDLTNPIMREYWIQRYGARYYHFVYKNVLFLMLDSEDYSEERMNEIYLARADVLRVMQTDSADMINEMEYYQMPERVTGKIGDAQSKYFENIIIENSHVRWTFILMHKPVWQREDEYGLLRIEQAFGERPYTVFNGHFHSYSYNRKNNRDYMILGTTGGSQNPDDPNAFDHFTLVTMTKDEPSIVNVKMDGVIDKEGL